MRLSRLSQRFLDLLFPPRCVKCGKEGQYICSPCLASSPKLNPRFCTKCAQPLFSGDLCDRCRLHPLQVDRIQAPFIMEGAIREAVYRLKYGHLKVLAQILGGFLADYLQENSVSQDLITPVPLHPQREKERGYNQSALIASTLSKRVGVPYINKGLLRIKDTPPQAKTKDARERQVNVAGCFLWKGEALDGKRVLLVDDVCTTGSTLDACARALKDGGASSVWAVVVARES